MQLDIKSSKTQPYNKNLIKSNLTASNYETVKYHDEILTHGMLKIETIIFKQGP